MRPRRPVLLAVAKEIPWPMAHGFTLRVNALLAEMARDWDIVLTVSRKSLGEGYTAPDGVREVVPIDTTPEGALTPELIRRAVLPVVARERPAAALLWAGTEFLSMEDPSFPPAVIDRLDCLTMKSWRNHLHQTTLRGHLSVLRETLEWARKERRIVRGMAHTVVVGEDDARVMSRVAGRSTVHVVPNGVRLHDFAGLAGEAAAPTAMFTGVMNYPPNVDAVLHFAKNVWPLVRAEVPDAEFVIAGRQPDPAVEDLARTHPGVRVLADVPDMFTTLRSAWVAVAPMRTGSGIKNKVLEAWAVGRPCVMSAGAANGIKMDDTARSLIATSHADMARMTVRLLRDRAERARVGAAAHALAAAHHGWAAVAEQMTRVLDLARGAAPRPAGAAAGTRASGGVPNGGGQPASSPEMRASKPSAETPAGMLSRGAR